MAYSTSRKTLDKMLPTMQQLAEGKPCAWMLENDIEAGKFAYKVREALTIALRYKDEYPTLAAASERFIIQTDGPKVFAVVTTGTTEAVILVDGERRANTQGLAKAGPVLATSGPQSAFTIIDIWRRMQPNSDPVHFPQAGLDDANLTMLYNFCKTATPPLMMMVSGDSVTVSLVDRAVVEYSWTPTAQLGKRRAGWNAIGFGAREKAQDLKEEQADEEPEVEDNDK